MLLIRLKEKLGPIVKQAVTTPVNFTTMAALMTSVKNKSC